MAGSKRKRARKDTDEAHAAAVTAPHTALSFSTHNFTGSTPVSTSSVIGIENSSSSLEVANKYSASIPSIRNSTHTASSCLSIVPDGIGSTHPDRKSVTFDRASLKPTTTHDTSDSSVAAAAGGPSGESHTVLNSSYARHKSTARSNCSRRRPRSRSSSGTTSAPCASISGDKGGELEPVDEAQRTQSSSATRSIDCSRPIRHGSRVRSRRQHRKRRLSASHDRTRRNATASTVGDIDRSVKHRIHFATGASESKQRRRERQRSVVSPVTVEPGLLLDPNLVHPFHKSLPSANNEQPVPIGTELVALDNSSSTLPSSVGVHDSRTASSHIMRARQTTQAHDHDSSHAHDSSSSGRSAAVVGTSIPSVYLLPSSVGPLTGASDSEADGRGPRYVPLPAYAAAVGATTHHTSSSFVRREIATASHGLPVDLTVGSANAAAHSVAFVPHLLLHGPPVPESAMMSHTSFLSASDTQDHHAIPSNVHGSGANPTELAWDKHLRSYQALRDANLVSTLLSQASFAQPVTGFSYPLATHSGGTSYQLSQAPPTLQQQASVSLAPLLAQHTVNTSPLVVTSMSGTSDNGAGVGGSPSVSSAGSDAAATMHHQLLNPISVARLIALNQPVPAIWSRPAKPASGDTAGGSTSGTRSTHHTTMASAYPASHQSQPTQHYYYQSSGSGRTTSRHASLLESNGNNLSGRFAHGSRSGNISTLHPGPGRHSPHTSGINNRIAQLQLNQADRSVQLILLQDINQILLMGFEETLVNLNVHGLVTGVLEILECEDDTLIELKTLGCNVLAHMMDALPRSADAVVPALPLLLTTMSSSFVGDILERIINLLEQLSRRHGREVLKSGAISAVLGFYDFVTLAQHRTILTMVANCFVNLQPGDFQLIADSLPSLAERLKESEPRCVERVCTCFARLVLAYRAEPEVLRRIVSSCNLFANLQHLLMASPPILSGVRDVVHMLAIICSSCPYLAVELIKHNISSTLHCILTGEAINSDALQAILLAPIPLPSMAQHCITRATSKHGRSRSGSGSQRKRFSSGTGPSTNNRDGPTVWQPLMLPYSPLSDTPKAVPDLAIHQRTQEDVHGVVHLICEFLPPVPTAQVNLFHRSPGIDGPFQSSNAPPQSAASVYSESASMNSLSATACSVAPVAVTALPGSAVSQDQRRGNAGGAGSTGRNPKPQRSESDRADSNRRNLMSRSQRFSEPSNHATLDSNNNNRDQTTMSCSSVSSASSETLRHACLPFPHETLSSSSEDPRANLLYQECEALHARLLRHQGSHPDDHVAASSTRRRSSGRQRSGDHQTTPTASSTNDMQSPSEVDRDRATWDEETQALQLVQTLLPLLFELFTETTKLQTRVRCLEAIQRMLFYSSPILLAKVLRPRLVCSHIVGMLNSPEQCVILAGLHIALMLVDRIPAMFSTYFRKEGILHQVEQLRTSLGSVHPVPGAELNSSKSHNEANHDNTVLVANHGIQSLDVPGHESSCGNWLRPDGQNVPGANGPLLLPNGYRRVPSTEPSTPVSDRLRRPQNNGARGGQSIDAHPDAVVTALSTPTLPLCVEGDDVRTHDTFSLWIIAACEQLQNRVSSLMFSLAAATDPYRPVKGAVDSMDDALAGLDLGPNTTASNTVPGSSSLASIDLMPKLTAIATHLGSTKPALWVFAFAQLIELLRPGSGGGDGSPVVIETPSPFELQKSGVTAALLNYLTEPERREIRLWILYRMFFGHRASTDIRLLSGMNLIQLSRKQAASSKNWPHLLSVSPVLLDSAKAEQLCEVDRFLNAQLQRPVNDPASDGSDAFYALVQCLLACFHRHEHFQICSVPPLLPPDSKLLNLLQSQPFPSSEDSPHQPLHKLNSTSAGYIVPHTLNATSSGTSLSPSGTTIGTSLTPALYRSIDSPSTWKSGDRGTIPVVSTATSTSDPTGVVIPATHFTPLIPHLLSTVPLGALSRPIQSAGTSPPVVPQPGFLCIDLVRVNEQDGDIYGDAEDDSGIGFTHAENQHGKPAAATSFGSSRLPTGTTSVSSSCRRKNVGRKSSASSVASSTHSNASTLTNEPNCAMPNRFSLQISALATLQNLERLLVQRNYVNQLIYDGLWNPDHDYGLNLSSLIGGYPESRDDEFRSLLDVHILDEDSDPNGVDGDDADDHEHQDVEDDDEDVDIVVVDEDAPRKTNGPRNRFNRSRSRDAVETEVSVSLKRSHTTAASRAHRRAPGSTTVTGSHNRRSDRARLAQSTHAHSHASQRTSEPGAEVHVRAASFNSLPAPAVNRVIYPGLFARSGTTEAQPSGDATSGRGLRTLLQRSPNVAPITTRLELEQSLTVPSALRPIDTRGSRRRSVATPHNLETVSGDCHPLATSSSPSMQTSSRSHVDSSIEHETVHSRSVRESGSHTNKADQSNSAAAVTPAPSSSSRHRRLKGSSILAAFGALANLSTAGSSTGTGGGHNSGSGSKGATGTNSTRQNSKSGQNGTGGSSVRRAFMMNHSSSAHSSSSASSSCSSSVSSHPSPASPFGRFDGRWTHHHQQHQPGKHRHRPSAIRFYVGGHQLPPNMALFEAVRRFSTEFGARLSAAVANADRLPASPKSSLNAVGASSRLTDQEVEDLAGHLMWSMTHTIQYRLVYAASESSTHGSSATPHGVHGPSNSGTSSAAVSQHRKSDSHLTTHVAGLASRAFNLSLKTSDPCLSSSVGSSSVSTTIGTCLKRRRPDLETESSPVRPANQTATTSTGTSTTHPLFVHLQRQLPRGFLSDVRCACIPTSSSSKSGCAGPCESVVCRVQSHAGNTDSLLDETVTTSLALLRTLHSISRLWYTVHDALDPFPIVSPLAFRSPKLAIKAGRQLQDVFSVLAGNLPTWLVQLIAACPFLFPFDVRRTFFYAYHFDRDRTLLRFQDTVASSVSELEQHPQSVSLESRGLQLLVPNGLLDGGLHIAAGSGPGGLSPRSGAGSSTNSDLSAPTTALSSALSSPGSTAWTSSVSTDSTAAAGSGSTTAVAATVALRPQRLSLHPRGRYATRITLAPSLRRHKVTVHRDGKRLLRQAEATLADLLSSRAVLEIAFDGEVGFGLGPTLEFYTLVSRQLMKSSLGLWHGNEVTAEGYVIAPPPGLYPRPLAKQARSAVVREVRSKFLFLGRLMARALLDGRQLDLPFSPAFFKWFLGSTPAAAVSEGHILPNDLALVDPELGRHVRQLTELANRRQALQRQLDQAATSGPNAHLLFATNATSRAHHSSASAPMAASHVSSKSARGGPADTRKLDELKAALLILDNEVEDLCLNFVLPGYEIELLKNGSHIIVTGSNLGDYLRLVAHWLVIEGVSRQMESVIEGFDSVLPDVRPRLAVLFQPDEMEGLFCGRSQSQFESPTWTTTVNGPGGGGLGRTHPGSPAWLAGATGPDPEGWDVASLTEACRCDHGYTPQSRTIRHLFEVMSEFSDEERRLFVQFVTGSPRLPVGGFRALKPPLKIVMKRESGENADHHLPSVMTCQNYLKLPDYSTKELLASKLRYAIREGQNAFHLS